MYMNVSVYARALVAFARFRYCENNYVHVYVVYAFCYVCKQA